MQKYDKLHLKINTLQTSVLKFHFFRTRNGPCVKVSQPPAAPVPRSDCKSTKKDGNELLNFFNAQPLFVESHMNPRAAAVHI